jgi:hypothetical protein
MIVSKGMVVGQNGSCMQSMRENFVHNFVTIKSKD